MVALAFCGLSLVSLPSAMTLAVLGCGVAWLSPGRVKAQIIMMLLFLEFLALNVTLILLFSFPFSSASYPMMFSFFVLAVSEASFGLAMLVSFYRAHNSAFLK